MKTKAAFTRHRTDRSSLPVFAVLAPFLLGLWAATSVSADPPPWLRTEVRMPCSDFETFRKPLFGETHIHTVYSSDAVVAGTVADPRGAYEVFDIVPSKFQQVDLKTG
jgi:hypothetical protein